MCESWPAGKPKDGSLDTVNRDVRNIEGQQNGKILTIE